MQEIIWPKGLQECLLPEESFAEAYQALESLERAYLKQCIAQVFAWYGASSLLHQEQTRQWEQGFSSLHRSRPWPWVLILVQPEMRAPAPLVAAVLPALLAGSAEIIVLQSSEQASWPLAQLCGLELAGLELVGAVAPDMQKDLLQGLNEKNGPGLVLHLGHGFQGMELVSGLDSGGQRLALFVPSKAGIWQDSTVKWDFQALHTALPDLELEDYVPQEYFASRAGMGDSAEALGLEESQKKDWGLLFVPEHMQQQALEQARLVLCPGQESCWIWPGLQACLFQRSGLALGSL
ncbi:MAG: hypothetical protein ACLFPG_06110 [Desulfohalobiaceae bacterium]